MVKQNLDTDTLDTQILYSIRLYCYGTLGMTREWVLTDNITPARTAAQMMLESMPETLKQIFPINHDHPSNGWFARPYKGQLPASA